MISIHQNIVTQVDAFESGRILFPTDFRGTGTITAIKMSLCRIATEGRLIRLAHGIYLKPRRHKNLDRRPSLEEIAVAIAKREHVKIKAAGELALYKLGLSKIYPSNLVFVTNGEPRNIKIGEHILIFKPTTPKKFRMKGAVSSLLIQVMEDMGQHKISEEMRKKIYDLIKTEDQMQLIADINLAPGWIYNLLFKMNKEILKHNN